MVRVLSLWLSALAASAAVAQAPPMPSPFESTPNSIKPASFQDPVPVEPISPLMVVPNTPDGGLFPCAPAPAPPPKLWKGSFDAGANGSSGNSDLLNVRGFVTADRTEGNNLLHTDFTYLLGTEERQLTQNTAVFNARNEVGINNTPCYSYVSTFADYDVERDYRFIAGLFAGLGCKVHATDTTKLKIYGGFGVAYKTGAGDGIPDVWESALNLGYNYRYQFTKRSAFISDCDYYPALDFSEFLLRLRASYECTVDPESGLFFRIGFFERFDSNPGPGFDKSDLNYYTALGFNF